MIFNSSFAILLADDLIDAKKPVLKQMVDLYNETGSSVLGVQQVAREETKQYGIVATQEKNTLQKIIEIVEKPEPDKAPSTLGVVGRYLLTPEIFDYLRQTQPGSGGEIQLTDGIARLLKDQDVLALPFDGVRYDCGSKLGYLKATIAFGVRHHEVGQQFLEWLKLHEGSYGN